MFLSAALALATLTAPAAGPAEMPAVPPELLRSFAGHLDILDEREERSFFNAPQTYDSDLRILRERYAELRDAPSLCDASRFPDVDSCIEARCFNEAYRRWLEQRRELTHEEWIDEALEETARLWRAWDTLADAQKDYLYLSVRRKALKDLREQLGPVMYYAGCMPPGVPAWRVRRID